jgi:hypothetical protein
MKKYPMLEMMRSLINDQELMALPENERALELRERALVGYRDMYRENVARAMPEGPIPVIFG